MCARDIQCQPSTVSKSAVDEDDGLYSASKPPAGPAAELSLPSYLGAVRRPVKTPRDWSMITQLPC